MSTKSVAAGNGTILSINGSSVAVWSDLQTPLLFVLRDELGLVGTKGGCGQGECGVCTIWLDGRPERACLTPLGEVHDRAVTTIEGLPSGGLPQALQRAFIDHQAGQCGYCLPGLLMEAAALRDAAEFDDVSVRDALDEHLCRCGSHVRILAAIRSVVTSEGAAP